jgi:hypothetical protein
LGEVDQTVLISRVDAMLGKVVRIRVVDEVVEGGNNRVVKNLGEVEFARGIERSVNANGNESGEESGRSKEDEGEGSSSCQQRVFGDGQVYSLAPEVWQEDGRWKEQEGRKRDAVQHTNDDHEA